MALENATTINQLNPLFPVATDGLAQADDHMRLIKSTIQNTFPNITGAITATQAEINKMDGVTATTAELNKLDGFTGTFTDLNYAKDLRATGVTSTEFDYLDGVTSNIQTQLNSKQPTITGAATTIDGSNLTANRALVSNGSGKVAVSSLITSTELDYLNGVSSNIQTQLNAKQATITGAASTGTSSNLTANRAMITNSSGKMSISAVTSTELGYLDGVTSNIQTQFNNATSYPLAVRVFTSGTSYTVPAGAKAILIKASGGGGGGSHWIFSGNNSGNGSAGAQTTVTNGTLGISITAKGGAAGIVGTGGYQDFLTGDSGGDVQRGKGAIGGSAYNANYDTAAFRGGPANLVTKYVQSSSVGGQTISFSLGAGGAGSSYGRQGETGYVEITVW